MKWQDAYGASSSLRDSAARIQDVLIEQDDMTAEAREKLRTALNGVRYAQKLIDIEEVATKGTQ
jgi:hypothetical protein